MDVQVVISVAALGLSAFIMFLKIFEGSMTVREHEAFRESIRRELQDIKDRIVRLESAVLLKNDR